jgi:uncharacterized repeat protein (TIGR01451 family)
VATVTSTTPDPNTARNSSLATTSLATPVADVSVTKTDNVAVVTAGLSTTYSFTVTIVGPASATATRVADTFDPATFASVEWQCAASGTSMCTTSGLQTGSINTLVNINPGPANAIVFTVQAQVRPDAIGPIENAATATVASGVTDPTPANNTATDVDTVTRVADMSIAKTGPPSILPGTTADYTIAIANAGPSTVRDFVFVEAPQDGAAFPDGLWRPELIQNIQPPADSRCEIQPVLTPTGEFAMPVCTVPLLTPGETRVFTVRLAVPPDYRSSSTAALTNAAIFTFADVDDDPDSDDLVALATSTVMPQADIAVTKVGPTSVVAGSIVSYFIGVSNEGQSTATNVVVEDPIPAGLVLQSADGPCAAGFPCTIPTLAPGQSQTTRIDLLISGWRKSVSRWSGRAD